MFLSRANDTLHSPNGVVFSLVDIRCLLWTRQAVRKLRLHFHELWQIQDIPNAAKLVLKFSALCFCSSEKKRSGEKKNCLPMDGSAAAGPQCLDFVVCFVL
jgi:hypothetical protein